MTLRHLRRSPVAGLAAFVVAVTSFLFLTASPSAAQAPGPIQTKINDAIALAKVKLAERPECNALLSAPLFSGPSARDALGTATNSFREDPPPGVPENAFASVARVGAGLNQDIEFYRNFDRIGTPGPSFLPNFQGRPEVALNRFDIVRAVAVLHEVGHLTGAEGDHAPVQEDGVRISRDREEGLYNTRILNVCFGERFLITGLSCSQTFSFNSIYDFRSNLECFGGCRTDAGPLTLSWSWNLSPTFTPDVITTQDGEVCNSFRTSGCPFTDGTSLRPEVTFTATDATGRTSSDTVLFQCINPWVPVW